MKLVSGSSERTLAPYFSKKKPDVAAADKILAQHKDHWPTGILNTQTLRASFEAGEMPNIATMFGRLESKEFEKVSEALFHGLQNPGALKGLQNLITHLKDPRHIWVVQAEIFVYQPWKTTKKTLGAIDGSDAGSQTFTSAFILATKTSNHGRYALIKPILDAFLRSFRQK